MAIIRGEVIRCDNCGKDCTDEFLTAINPLGGFGRDRFLMCDACLDAAPEGSHAAEVRDAMRKPH
jgi:hypothetical protein